MRCPIMISALIFSLLLAFTQAFAETLTFTREYTYESSQFDSQASSRTLALSNAKRFILDELGAFLVNSLEAKKMQLTKDQIITYMAGIISAETIDEKWDGKNYLVKAKMSADPDEAMKAIQKIVQDNNSIQTLEDAAKKTKELSKENEKLKRALEDGAIAKKHDAKAEAKNIKEYENTIKGLEAVEWLERGFKNAFYANWKEALDAYTNAINLKPDYAIAYMRRGMVYSRFLDNYQQAIKDFTKAIEHKPDFAEAYFYRCSVHSDLGNYKQSIKDCTKAIELKPDFSGAYNNRGYAYVGLGYQEAIKDYDKAVELDPKDVSAYFSRGIAYDELGDHQRAVNDFKTAAKWGDKRAQDILTKEKIQW